ncbi:hypothetical protein [Pseudokineococcus lusitanus]|uniref:hypothetical protein n=1 Tax=Pseudokineococcus lusitanus TaxID=763993 RepID=UPI0018F5F478
MSLRRAVHARGLRYRVDSPLPGMPRRRADLLLTRARIAVFVDDCFWRGCPVHATTPMLNVEWWAESWRRIVVVTPRPTSTCVRWGGWPCASGSTRRWTRQPVQ